MPPRFSFNTWLNIKCECTISIYFVPKTSIVMEHQAYLPLLPCFWFFFLEVCHTLALPSIYEAKQGSLFVLFCSYEIHQTRMLEIVSLVSLESFWQRGVHWAWFLQFGLALQKFLNIEWFLHWKLKLNSIVVQNCRGIGMCIWCCWKKNSFHIWLFKKSIHTLQNNVLHMLRFPIL